tara:strand:+ start:348 stop:1436 length:1089 start_codon:yes stop_codon:yes gene_type:complete
LGYFKNINLYNFRNFESLSLDFSNNCNVFFGQNGVGKTNILEAISLFSKGRGFRKDRLTNILKKNCKKFTLKSFFINQNISYELLVESYESNNKLYKKSLINGDKSKEAHESLYTLSPFLYFLPETERLFISSPSNRRNFIDRLIFSYNYSYLNCLNEYNKNLIERTKLLSSPNYDNNWLEIIEKKISSLGIQIYLFREKQIMKLLEYLNYFSGEYKLPYEINFKIKDDFYLKNINENIFIEQLKINRKIDSIIGGSKIGPHKSDYIFYIQDNYLVSQLSTGQQKTLILLMYLSQCKYLIDLFSKKPILLLDEICSHLDEVNRNILLTLVESFDLQIFMTGTSKNLFSFLSTKSNFCNITNQ